MDHDRENPCADGTAVDAYDRYRKLGIYGTGFFYTVIGMAQVFFTLYAQETGAATAMIGLMVTMRALLPMFIAMPVGQLIDSIGPIKMLQSGSLLLILSLLLTASTGNLWLLTLSQVLMGACYLLMGSSFQVLVSEGEKNKRNESIKQYAMWQSIGNTVGPLIGGAIMAIFISPIVGYRFVFTIAGGASIVFFLLLLIVAKRWGRKRSVQRVSLKERVNMREMTGSYRSGFRLARNRSVQFGLLANFLIIFISTMYNSFMPLFLNELGYAMMTISTVIALMSLASTASRFALGWIMRRTHMERIILVAGLIAAAGVALTPVMGGQLAGIVILTFVMGGALGINMPVSIMIVVNDTPEADRGKLMGLRLITNRAAQMLSPALFGVLGQTLGFTLAFYTGGGALVVAVLGFSAYSSLKWKLKTDAIDSAEQRKGAGGR